jgi:IclR family acetate operon transcriptional repressor
MIEQSDASTPTSQHQAEVSPDMSRRSKSNAHVSLAEDADTEGQGKGTGSALGRALTMLDVLLETEESVGLQELSARLNIPRQSAHRILNQLLDHGLLQRHIMKDRYTMGPRMRHLAMKAVYRSHTTGPYHAFLEQIASQSEETCTLGVLDHNKVLIVDSVESEQALRVHAGIGRRLDPHVSGIGKVLLAHMPKPRRRQLLEAAQPMTRVTPYTVIDVEQLEQDFAEIRRSQYCLSNQATTLGMLVVAVPIRGPDGQVMAGLSIQAPLVRLDEERARRVMVPLLQEGARGIERLLGRSEEKGNGR